jgi:hypothetical protein
MVQVLIAYLFSVIVSPYPLEMLHLCLKQDSYCYSFSIGWPDSAFKKYLVVQPF